MSNGNTPTTVTIEFLDRLVASLEASPDAVGEAALQFLSDKREVLLGLAIGPLLELLKSAKSGGNLDLLNARRRFIDGLPYDQALYFYEQSVKDLEASAEEPFRLGSFLSSLAEYLVGVAPRLVLIIASNLH